MHDDDELSSDDNPTLEEPIDAVRAWREARLRNTTPRPGTYTPPPDDRPTLPPSVSVSGAERADEASNPAAPSSFHSSL